ncbi:MAG: leucine-rich repeat domain-containing protein [Oscillospiraceae bacterium]|nr:leucine-rich repeat domain-containing protein [Oscillospiraceae bacterium]
MSTTTDFIIQDGVLQKYTGAGGDVVVPEGVTTIGRAAFRGCHNLTSVTIPNGVNIIEGVAFESCSGLISVTIPDSVNYIGGKAFDSCCHLRNISIPDNITHITSGMFRNCRSLTSITLSQNIKGIADMAFDSCAGISELTISNGATKMQDYAFNGCENLSSISFPAGINEFPSHVFRGCNKLKSLNAGNTVILPAEIVETLVKNISDITVPSPYFVAPKLRPLAVVRFSKTYQGDFSDDDSQAYLNYLSLNTGELVNFALTHIELLDIMCKQKCISANHVDDFLRAAQAANNTEAISMLLSYKDFAPCSAVLDKEDQLSDPFENDDLTDLSDISKSDLRGEAAVFSDYAMESDEYDYDESESDLQDFATDDPEDSDEVVWEDYDGYPFAAEVVNGEIISMTDDFQKKVIAAILTKLGVTEAELCEFLSLLNDGDESEDGRFDLLADCEYDFLAELLGYDADEEAFSPAGIGFLESSYGFEAIDLLKQLGFPVEEDITPGTHGHGTDGVVYVE